MQRFEIQREAVSHGTAGGPSGGYMRRSGLLIITVLSFLVAMPASAIDWDKIVVNGYTSFEFERMLEQEGGGWR